MRWAFPSAATASAFHAALLDAGKNKYRNAVKAVPSLMQGVHSLPHDPFARALPPPKSCHRRGSLFPIIAAASDAENTRAGPSRYKTNAHRASAGNTSPPNLFIARISRKCVAYTKKVCFIHSLAGGSLQHPNKNQRQIGNVMRYSNSS